MTNIIMYHKKLDGRGAMCGWQRLSKYNGVAPSECACVCAVLCMCVLSLQAILLMFPAVNPLLGYLLYKAAKWLACMKKKVVSSASVHIYTAHSTRTVRVCGKGMRGNRVKERGTATETQISTERRKET